MLLTVRHTFAAPPDRVHAMLVDRAFLDHACEQLGADECRTSSGDDVASVMASVPTPDAVRGFLGPRMSARQEYTWDAPGDDGSRTGTLFLTVEGAPVLVNGVTALRPVAAGTAFDLDATLSVSVPLIGTTIERAAAPELQQMLEAQVRLGDAWLARP